jgi:hypothetical protein
LELETAEFCREIETYLCRKNDGHLIRIVGPSFEIVSRWAAEAIPLKVAFRGIDRYFDRYYGKGPRRRPVKIDFCEADVLDVFDEWRKALGLQSEEGAPPPRSRESLPSHLERVVMRLTSLRASGSLGDAFDAVVDRAAGELDAARASPRGLRGEARQALIARLAALDGELLATARATLERAAFDEIAAEADEELARFRQTMAPDAFARAREAAVDRLLRDRLGLPVIRFE